jgi:hypothetical protein
VHHRNRDCTDNRLEILAALHRHCHDAVHGPGGSEPLGSVHDQDCLCEEPYECESLTYGSEDQPGGGPPG